MGDVLKNAVTREPKTTTDTRDQFCIKSAIRDEIFHVSENFMLLYNRKPLADGHSLIVTRRHTLGLLDLTATEAREIFDLLHKVLPLLLNTYNNGEKNYDLKIRSGSASGRTVNHFHIHMIPRKRVSGENGSSVYERIYERSLQNPDRPVLDDGEANVKILKRGLEQTPNATTHASEGEHGVHAESPLPLENAFYESEHFIAMYHPSPFIEGHTILVPKRNVKDILELTEEEAEDMARAYSKVMNVLLKTYGDESRSYITSMQTGGYAGAPVDRLHINLIPRSKSDRYEGRDDYIYYDIYESGSGGGVQTSEEIRKEVAALKRLV